MGQPMNGAMPRALELKGNYRVRFVALDATTGAEVADVSISEAAIQVDDRSPGPLSNLATGSWLLVPEKGP
jgi:hypothetical protein